MVLRENQPHKTSLLILYRKLKGKYEMKANKKILMNRNYEFFLLFMLGYVLLHPQSLTLILNSCLD
jgi:hypothetical protein